MVYEDLIRIVVENDISSDKSVEVVCELTTSPKLTKKHRETKATLSEVFGEEVNIIKKSFVKCLLGGSYNKMMTEKFPDEIRVDDTPMLGRNWTQNFYGIVSESLDGNTKYVRIYPTEFITTAYYYTDDNGVPNEELSNSDVENLKGFLPVKKEGDAVVLMDVKLENVSVSFETIDEE